MAKLTIKHNDTTFTAELFPANEREEGFIQIYLSKGGLEIGYNLYFKELAQVLLVLRGSHYHLEDKALAQRVDKHLTLLSLDNLYDPYSYYELRLRDQVDGREDTLAFKFTCAEVCGLEAVFSTAAFYVAFGNPEA